MNEEKQHAPEAVALARKLDELLHIAEAGEFWMNEYDPEADHYDLKNTTIDGRVDLLFLAEKLLETYQLREPTGSGKKG